jgi:hypothetical protein
VILAIEEVRRDASPTVSKKRIFWLNAKEAQAESVPVKHTLPSIGGFTISQTRSLTAAERDINIVINNIYCIFNNYYNTSTTDNLPGEISYHQRDDEITRLNPFFAQLFELGARRRYL